MTLRDEFEDLLSVDVALKGDDYRLFLRTHGHALLAALEDAERYRWLRDDRSVSMTLTHNGEHAMNYMNASEWIDKYPESFEDTPPFAVSAMRESGSIWEVDWYPDTPIGFYNCYRATLDEAIDEAMRIDALAREANIGRAHGRGE